jgi:hypothetical protein
VTESGEALFFVQILRWILFELTSTEYLESDDLTRESILDRLCVRIWAVRVYLH